MIIFRLILYLIFQLICLQRFDESRTLLTPVETTLTHFLYGLLPSFFFLTQYSKSLHLSMNKKKKWSGSLYLLTIAKCQNATTKHERTVNVRILVCSCDRHPVTKFHHASTHTNSIHTHIYMHTLAHADTIM